VSLPQVFDLVGRFSSEDRSLPPESINDVLGHLPMSGRVEGGRFRPATTWQPKIRKSPSLLKWQRQQTLFCQIAARLLASERVRVRLVTSETWTFRRALDNRQLGALLDVPDDADWIRLIAPDLEATS
jgi:hypothetical protein